MKKFYLFLFLILLLLPTNISFASPVARTWVYATLLIQNEWGEKGTGFLVTRKVDKDKSKIFLCTNKHVLNKKKELRDEAKEIIVHLNVKGKNGKIIGKPQTIPLVLPNGTKRWREHLDENVDILVIDITDIIIKFPEIEKKWADYALFADEKILSDQEITIGDEIMVVGYPLGFKQGETNFPIVRQGIIASQIGQKFIEEYKDEKGDTKSRVYRGFLIDGGIIPGSSGSPVVLKPVSGRLVGENIIMDMPPMYLLGIVSETRFAPIKTNISFNLSYAGLGIAFDASAIKEAIELFFK